MGEDRTVWPWAIFDGAAMVTSLYEWLLLSLSFCLLSVHLFLFLSTLQFFLFPSLFSYFLSVFSLSFSLLFLPIFSSFASYYHSLPNSLSLSLSLPSLCPSLSLPLCRCSVGLSSFSYVYRCIYYNSSCKIWFYSHQGLPQHFILPFVQNNHSALIYIMISSSEQNTLISFWIELLDEFKIVSSHKA